MSAIVPRTALAGGLIEGEGASMIARTQTANRRSKTSRLPLLKERYQKLILKQRQEIEKELLESFQEENDLEMETESEPDQTAMIETE
jgi:hypothetical protein